MLAIFVRSGGIIQGAGMSLAAFGIMMHVLNVVNLTTPALSHSWSAVALAGFFTTTSIQIGNRLIMKTYRSKQDRRPSPAGARNNVALP